jgi:hypothetical protein
LLLAAVIADQVLADFDAGIHRATRFAVHGDGVVDLAAAA